MYRVRTDLAHYARALVQRGPGREDVVDEEHDGAGKGGRASHRERVTDIGGPLGALESGLASGGPDAP